MKITDEVVREHRLYRAQEESIEEASDYISYLSSSNEWLTAGDEIPAGFHQL